MNQTEPTFTSGWAFRFPNIIFWVACSAIVIRVLTSLAGAIDKPPDMGFFATAWRLFIGKPVSGEEREHHTGDYWYPFIISIFELVFFPIFMVVGKWEYVGAWVAFKTVGSWAKWTERRPAFNRFLLGNLLVISAAYLILLKVIIH